MPARTLIPTVRDGAGSRPNILFRDNLVAAWRMDAVTGAARTDPVNGLDLTSNGAGGGVSRVAGLVGYGAGFARASSQYLSRARASAGLLLPGSGSFSVALAVYFETVSGEMNIYGQYAVTGNQRGYLLTKTNTGNILQIVVSPDGTATTTVSLGAVAAGQWYWVYWGWDATSQRLFGRVNQAAAVETAFAGPIFASATQDFKMGVRDTNSAALDGRIDCAFHFSGILGEDDQEMLYNNGLGRQGADLVQY